VERVEGGAVPRGDWKGNERGVRSILELGQWGLESGREVGEEWSKRDNRYKNNLVSKQNVRDQYRKKRGGRSRERMVLEVRGEKRVRCRERRKGGEQGRV